MRPSLKLGTWNVRTMLSGISDDLRSINDLRKTAVINNELSRLNVDIVALQETRLAEAASLREKEYTFIGMVNQKMRKGNMVLALL